MAYQALYRKYRPTNFDEVFGQDVVIQTLKNSLNSGKTSHAYMFSGPRGVGKTSIAKIFAKAINCLNLEAGNACNHCENCNAISLNETTDIIEIDAASNNGVDEIREIRSKINLVPSELNYKVYIIDEVHMLSIGAFNALLKTLEEPPAHAIFILATTDPHKVPITIVSRCQCFEFKRISEKSIVERLKEICKMENIDIDQEVLEKIAFLSDGGMRDALGLLDKVSSYSDSHISISDFNSITGVADDNFKKEFVSAIYEHDIVKFISQVDELYDSGKDLIIFVQDLMSELRNYMLDYYLQKVEVYSIDFVLKFLIELDKILIDLKNSSNLKIMFEAAVLSFINGTLEQETLKMKNRAGDSKNVEIISHEVVEKKLEENIKSNTDAGTEMLAAEKVKHKNISSPNENHSLTKLLEIRPIVVNNTFATAQKKYLLSLKEQWNKINDFVLDKSYGAAACYLVDSQLKAVGEKDLIITCNYESVLDRGIGLLMVMQELLEKIFDKKYRIAILTEKEWEEEKTKYVQTKKRNEIYVYQDISTEDYISKTNIKSDDVISVFDESEDIVQQAISIFGEDIVKVNNN